MSNNATTLITESITYNKIAYAPWSAALESDLCMESDDSVAIGYVTEFWGVDDDGNDWRVHLTTTG